VNWHEHIVLSKALYHNEDKAANYSFSFLSSYLMLRIRQEYSAHGRRIDPVFADAAYTDNEIIYY
jgi:hypothetical protein